MSKIKYSAIIGSLGQTCDRFMKCGYKDPEVDNVEFPDIIKSLEKMRVLQGVDLYQAPTGPLSDPVVVNEILTGSGLDLLVTHVRPPFWVPIVKYFPEFYASLMPLSIQNLDKTMTM